MNFQINLICFSSALSNAFTIISLYISFPPFRFRSFGRKDILKQMFANSNPAIFTILYVIFLHKKFYIVRFIGHYLSMSPPKLKSQRN